MDVEADPFMERTVSSSKAAATSGACTVRSSGGIAPSRSTRIRLSRSDQRRLPSSRATSAIFSPVSGMGPLRIVEPTAIRSMSARRPSDSDSVTRAALLLAFRIAGVTGREAMMRESRGSTHDSEVGPGRKGQCAASAVGR